MNMREEFKKFVHKEPFPEEMTVSEKDLCVWEAAWETRGEHDAKICEAETSPNYSQTENSMLKHCAHMIRSKT